MRAGAGAAGGKSYRRSHEPGSNDREALDRARTLGSRRGLRGCTSRRCYLLLEHVENGCEDRPDATLRERPGVRRHECLEQFRLALGVDPTFAGLVLVVADGCDELEPPVQQLEQAPVKLGDLGPERLEVAHWYRSPASTATASRFAGGANGQTQPGSYEHDGL